MEHTENEYTNILLCSIYKASISNYIKNAHIIPNWLMVFFSHFIDRLGYS